MNNQQYATLFESLTQVAGKEFSFFNIGDHTFTLELIDGVTIVGYKGAGNWYEVANSNMSMEEIAYSFYWVLTNE